MSGTAIPRLVLVKRDPFARSELSKERVYGEQSIGCLFCGNHNQTPKGRKFLFQFWHVSDTGRRTRVPGLFCSNQCHASYYA